MDAGRREIALRTLGRFDSARAFAGLVVASVDGSPIRLSDIGTVEDGTKEQRSASRLDGVPTVTLESVSVLPGELLQCGQELVVVQRRRLPQHGQSLSPEQRVEHL